MRGGTNATQRWAASRDKALRGLLAHPGRFNSSVVGLARIVSRANEKTHSRLELNAFIAAQAEVKPSAWTTLRVFALWNPCGYAKLSTSSPRASSSISLDWRISWAIALGGSVSN
jgi:hypothetical protein